MTATKRRGPSPIPWESVASLRAGLPRERDAWLALVLPHVDASTSHVEAAAAITAAGYPVARFQVCAWHSWLAAARLRGELPEHPQPLPSRQAGRVPSVEARAAGGRTTAARRRAKKDEAGVYEVMVRERAEAHGGHGETLRGTGVRFSALRDLRAHLATT